MSAAWRHIWGIWRRAAAATWEHLPSLIALNILWALACLPVLSAGPATAVLFWVGFRRASGETPRWSEARAAFRACLVPGLVWGMLLAALAALARINGLVYARLLPKPLHAGIIALWGYVFAFFYLWTPIFFYHAAALGRRWPRAARQAVWEVLANPIYLAAQLVPTGFAAMAGLVWRTSWILLLPALLANWLAYAVLAMPRPFPGSGPRPMAREGNEAGTDLY
ncbi:MAG: DUF624 domain-containing protein [Bacteroidota bacterium]